MLAQGGQVGPTLDFVAAVARAQRDLQGVRCDIAQPVETQRADLRRAAEIDATRFGFTRVLPGEIDQCETGRVVAHREKTSGLVRDGCEAVQLRSDATRERE